MKQLICVFFSNLQSKSQLTVLLFITVSVIGFSSCTKSNDDSGNNTNSSNLSSENNGKLRQIKCAKERNSSFFYTLFFDYDQNGRLISYGVLGGEKTVWTRNSNGRIIKEEFTAGGNSNFSRITNYYLNPNNSNQYLYYLSTDTNTSPSKDSGVFLYANNRVVQIGGSKFTYDSKGNLAAKVGSSITEEYTWDNNFGAISLADEGLFFGRFQGYNNIINEKIITGTNFNYSYKYNPHGRPASAVVTRTFTSSPTVIEYFEYLYDK